MAGAQDVLTAVARNVFERAERADLRGLETSLSELSGSVAPNHLAWRLALRAIQWSFAPRGAAPTAAEAAKLVHESGASEPLLRACAVMERIAFSTLDASALAAWLEVHAAVAQGSGDFDIDLAVARLWHDLLAGDDDAVGSAARALLDKVGETPSTSSAIEATVTAALAALSRGSIDESVELARRASRMAQAESLPHQEYLANLVLARVRRYSGRPHLALHILAALDRVAPAYWSGWIGWETLLAGGIRPESSGLDFPSARAERALRGLLEVARRGELPSFQEARARLDGAARVWPALQAEAAALIVALNPLEAEVPASMQSWCSGETPIIPFGLYGVSISPSADPEVETATAYVLGTPGNRGRRFLLPGLALIPDARVLTRDPARTAGRTETGLAALALAGEPGETRDMFFRRVYGFKFVAYRHRAVLDTLCHRMRSLLGEAGEIRREEVESTTDAEAASESGGASSSAISLTLRQAIVVPDMRCLLPTADRVLRALALVGPTSASAAAESLRMPLRTIQAVLQQLVADGACTIERDGRRVAYRVQDTTFTEVTVA
jgi:hypothetical protein